MYTHIYKFIAAMGLFVNVPVALAPGMGLNGFFATIAPTCPQNLTGDINGRYIHVQICICTCMRVCVYIYTYLHIFSYVSPRRY
jgi:xanthine/uracil/vitamin C permease (AzgA family)